MKNLLLNILLATCCTMSPYLISGDKARAEDWGCQVILCLSNPGGPTQYAECRPPIQKLWRELAEGHPFPTCSGVGFQSSRPGYEPYYCDDGYKLTNDVGPGGRQASCVSISPQPVSNSFCWNGDDYTSRGNSVLLPHWQPVEGRRQCLGYTMVRPNVRSQPHYVDITIDGAGKQRVWY
ncbi:UNVERIFIED_ORG: hypothetical protein GGD59_002476 [Rhizobium esperanzae]